MPPTPALFGKLTSGHLLTTGLGEHVFGWEEVSCTTSHSIDGYLHLKTFSSHGKPEIFSLTFSPPWGRNCLQARVIKCFLTSSLTWCSLDLGNILKHVLDFLYCMYSGNWKWKKEWSTGPAFGAQCETFLWGPLPTGTPLLPRMRHSSEASFRGITNNCFWFQARLISSQLDSGVGRRAIQRQFSTCCSILVMP